MLVAQLTETTKQTTQRALEEGWFERLIPQPEIRGVVLVAITCILIAVIIYIVMRVRGYSDNLPNAVDYLTEFEDLNERGAFSEEEMAKVKQSIRANLGLDSTGTSPLVPPPSESSGESSA
jgi:hypothetical protein